MKRNDVGELEKLLLGYRFKDRKNLICCSEPFEYGLLHPSSR